VTNSAVSASDGPIDRSNVKHHGGAEIVIAWTGAATSGRRGRPGVAGVVPGQ
jgi:hypothetical protein